MIVQWICHAVNKGTVALFVYVCSLNMYLFEMLFICIWVFLIYVMTAAKKVGKQQPNGACSLLKKKCITFRVKHNGWISSFLFWEMQLFWWKVLGW